VLFFYEKGRLIIKFILSHYRINMSYSRSDSFVSAEEYLQNEAQASYKSEYHNGVVIPVHHHNNIKGEILSMAGAQPAHNLIVARLLMLLNNCLDITECLVYASDQLVHIPSCNKFVYPDVSVVCQPPDYLANTSGLAALQNPSVIIEVLSESTEEYDRSEKFKCYRSLTSLEQYVLVASEEMQIETFTKQDDRHWLMTIAREPEEKLMISGCEVLLSEVYKKVGV
jgi:Uma2 family endonuclease